MPDVPWAGWRALLDGLFIYVAAQFLAALVALWLSGRTDDPEALLPLIVAVSPVISLLVALLWLRARYPGRVRDVFGAWPPRASDVAIGLGVGLLCLVGQQAIVAGVTFVAEQAGVELPPVQETFRAIAQRPGAVPLFAFTTVVLAPLAEEIVFRGLLFQGLRRTMGFWSAALASAVLFTLPHLVDGGGWLASAVIASGILPLGVVFAALVERRGSVVTSMAAHAAYNAVGVAALVMMGQ